MGTGETGSNDQVNVFPNPFTNSIKLETNTVITNLLILNAMGDYLKNVEIKEKEIDLSHFPAGIYFLKVENGSGSKSFKIIKD